MASGSALDLRGLRILVVEDEFLIADDTTRALRRYGAEVIGPMPSLDAVLSVLPLMAAVDAAIVDIGLRGEMAYPLVDALLRRDIQVVFTTGYAEGHIPSRYHHLPRWEKPYEIASVARHLARMPT